MNGPEELLDDGNIALIGPMGVGKSSIARLLGAWLDRQVVDTDELIEQATGLPVAEVFATRGEPAFRTLEADAITAVAERRGLVVATGGGVVLQPANVAALRGSGHVVLLLADPAELARRVEPGRRAGRRPLLGDGRDSLARLSALLEERRARYEAAAHVTVEVTGRPVELVAAEVLRALEDRVAGAR